MEKNKRILINVISQYARTVVCMVLSLYSTRIILATLGQSDFGIYALVASVVMMIGFITNSLATSTQRYLSYSWGKNDVNETKAVFANAMSIHMFIGIFFVVALALIRPLVVHRYLNIPENRIEAADFVYWAMLFIMAITFITAPVRAVFFARENIVFSSLVDIMDGTIKLVGAIALSWVTFDTLKAYAVLMAAITLITFLVFYLYASVHYAECHVPRWSELSKERISQMFGFSVWNFFSVGGSVVRTQGLAVVLNRFFGTIANSAYGIALQVSGAVSSIAGSVVNAINPQLMQAEGRQDREGMKRYAMLESKFSFLALSTLLLPLCFEMPQILSFWLGDYPRETPIFCTFILLIVVFDQSTIGLESANQALGKIRNYALILSFLRLMVIPISWICLYCGAPAYSVMMTYLGMEFFCALNRMYFVRKNAGLHIGHYIKYVYLGTSIPIVGLLSVSYLSTRVMEFPLRFILTEILGVATSLSLIYLFSLTANEKQWFRQKVLLIRKHR